MAKTNKTIFVCNECGYESSKWLGKCPACNSWNTFFEQKIDKVVENGTKKIKERIKPQKLNSYEGKEASRIDTGIDELNRVLGGGLVKGSLVLLGGEPGIGKSTLILQLCDKMADENGKVLYVSGEESGEQVKLRADRLGIKNDNIIFLGETDIDVIENTIEEIVPKLVIIYSVQTMYSNDITSAAGTVSQVREITARIMKMCKMRGITTVIIGHVTKDGTIAGPRVLEHMVDTVISFERNADDIRFLHAQKNRFGSVDEIGIFSMTEKGLEPVINPASLFLTKRKENQPAGVACTPVFEGSRVFLVEIQALTVPAKASVSRIYSEKIDSGRVARVAAVIEKRCGLCFSDQDLYVNVAGGIKLSESSIDAALAAALYSARTDIAVKNDTAVFGELSLAGEIRPITKTKQRIKAAEGLGFKTVLSPSDDEKSGISDIKTLIKTLFR